MFGFILYSSCFVSYFTHHVLFHTLHAKHCLVSYFTHHVLFHTLHIMFGFILYTLNCCLPGDCETLIEAVVKTRGGTVRRTYQGSALTR